jgi:hypothetical protein
MISNLLRVKVRDETDCWKIQRKREASAWSGWMLFPPLSLDFPIRECGAAAAGDENSLIRPQRERERTRTGREKELVSRKTGTFLRGFAAKASFYGTNELSHCAQIIPVGI